jgi:hypothetical protein
MANLDPVETMMVEVLLFDAKPGGVYEATSFTVFADGRLEVRLADGTVKTWTDDPPWMDVGIAGSFSPATRRPPKSS